MMMDCSHRARTFRVSRRHARRRRRERRINRRTRRRRRRAVLLRLHRDSRGKHRGRRRGKHRDAFWRLLELVQISDLRRDRVGRSGLVD